MNIQRSKYKDGTYAEAVAAGYDMFQLKYDGNWCCCHSEGHWLTFYSDTYRKFLEVDPIRAFPLGYFIGEFMRGTQWSTDPSRHGRFFVFDHLGLENDNRPYKVRYAHLRTMAAMLPDTWQIVQNYRMQSRDSIWTESVEKNGFEGLVYHKSDALPGGPLLREKRVITLEGRVFGWEPGEGKHEGRMGVVHVALADGTRAKIGNGWSDIEREEIAMNFSHYEDRVLEFSTNAIFSSGNVRHARFLRWRDDRVITTNNAKIPSPPNPPDNPPSSGPNTASSA